LDEHAQEVGIGPVRALDALDDHIALEPAGAERARLEHLGHAAHAERLDELVPSETDGAHRPPETVGARRRRKDAGPGAAQRRRPCQRTARHTIHPSHTSTSTIPRAVPAKPRWLTAEPRAPTGSTASRRRSGALQVTAATVPVT